MKKDYWVQAALTNDDMVAELLLRLKTSSDTDSDSLRLHPPLATTAITTILPPRWGHRKNRSKSTAPSTTVTKGFGKEHRASPTTHLSWSGGGGSTSDGYDESSRPSDLSSGCRSVKGSEGTSTSSCNRFEKRKSFVELKYEEGSLLKERIHINKDLASMRMTLNHQVATSEKLKRIKTDLDQKPRKKTGKMMEHEREMKPASLVNESVKKSCRVEAETEGPQRGFVLPDLNMTPSDEDLVMIS